LLVPLTIGFRASSSWPHAIAVPFHACVAQRATTVAKSESLPRRAHFRTNRFYFGQALRTRPAPADIQPVDHH
jgi:hypothetical protein